MRWIGELMLLLGRVLDSCRLGVVGGGGGGGGLISGVLESWSFCLPSPGGYDEWASFLGDLAAFEIWVVGLLLLLFEENVNIS